MLSKLLKVARGTSSVTSGPRVGAASLRATLTARAAPAPSSFSWTRGLSSTIIINEKRKKKSLFNILMHSELPSYSNPKLLEYLQERNLIALLKEAQDNQMAGDDFVVNLGTLRERFPEDLSRLEGLVDSDPALKPNLVPSLKTFSSNTVINPNSDHFYVNRRFATKLGPIVELGGGFILIHGPRSSGKSTLLNFVVQELDTTEFVFGVLESHPKIYSDDEAMWLDLMKDLSTPSSPASEEVRQAAANFLDPAKRSSSNPIMHLFRQNYNGKKLVLFWDEFSNAYTPAHRDAVSGALRSVSNFFKKKEGQLPSFQGVLCFGTYNANLVSTGIGSPFVEDKTFSNSDIDFTLAETQDLFRQFERERGVTVNPEVVENIRELTGGHTGLTNLCGVHITELMFPKDNSTTKSIGTTINLAQWTASFQGLLSMVFEHKVYKSMVRGVSQVPEPQETLDLLRRLCFGPGETLGSSVSFENLRQLGFASVQRIGGQDFLVIKSEFIRKLALIHVIRDTPAFVNVPMVDQNHVDVPKLLVECIRHFQPDIIEAAFQRFSKDHESTGDLVPKEFAYQVQLEGILFKALAGNKAWKSVYEASTSGKAKIDFLLTGPRDLRVGLELTASAKKSAIEKHALRDYPQTAKLTQYAVINFTPILPLGGFKHYFLPGIDRTGADTLVPVYHILHDEKFEQVHLFHAASPDAKEPTVVTILGQKFEGNAGGVVAATREGQSGKEEGPKTP